MTQGTQLKTHKGKQSIKVGDEFTLLIISIWYF